MPESQHNATRTVTLIFRGGLAVNKEIPVTYEPPETITWGGHGFKHEQVTPAEPWTYKEVWNYVITDPLPEGSS